MGLGSKPCRKWPLQPVAVTPSTRPSLCRVLLGQHGLLAVYLRNVHLEYTTVRGIKSCSGVSVTDPGRSGGPENGAARCTMLGLSSCCSFSVSALALLTDSALRLPQSFPGDSLMALCMGVFACLQSKSYFSTDTAEQESPRVYSNQNI